ncbi:MAG: glycoside hydrolase family 16 protein [Pyrinomonadaceae bacterium]|nr:glycoside hydrolase family 16 protein [Phycisphaerales bacterium]
MRHLARPLTCTIALLASAVSVSQARQAGWQLVWSDEFDGAAIDTTRWNVRNAPGNTNNELQYYAPDEVTVSGGMLHLRSQRRNFGGRSYTSGLVETRRKFAQTYGRVEICAKLPGTQGIWPAHWMLPESGIWPPEIDIMELLGHQPNTVHMTNHWGVWPQNQQRTGSYTGPDFTQGFHVFAMEWTPTRIEWYVDGVIRMASNSGVSNGLPFYIILNTAVGGIWPGNPDASTVFPQHHDIDYVRVYTREDPGAASRVLTDYTPAGAVVDGVINPNEYTAQINGINTGWNDRIGASSTLNIDSDDSGWVYMGIDGVAPWPAAPTPDGVVIYIDSKSGGLTSTITINDTANGTDLGRALTSGNARVGGGAADLFFADGFAADYAIFLQDTFAGIFRLSHGSLVFVTGISLNAPLDVFGGTSISYMRSAGDATQRELRLRLSDIDVAPGGAFNFVATQLNGDTGQRSNEYFGVRPGNWWDNVASSMADAQLKQGDFVTFMAQPRCLSDWDGSGKVTSQDFFDFLADFFAGSADIDNSETTTSQDFFEFIAAFFTGCV